MHKNYIILHKKCYFLLQTTAIIVYIIFETQQNLKEKNFVCDTLLCNIQFSNFSLNFFGDILFIYFHRFQSKKIGGKNSDGSSNWVDTRVHIGKLWPKELRHQILRCFSKVVCVFKSISSLFFSNLIVLKTKRKTKLFLLSFIQRFLVNNTH